MAPDPTHGADAPDAEVMASVDSTDRRPEFVIADVSCDDAWLSVREADAPILEEWC